MLNAITPEEALEIILGSFPFAPEAECAPITKALGRILAKDIVSSEFIPDFNRSTVDGYAVSARDTFGSTEAIPAILPIRGESLMGRAAGAELKAGECLTVPTGGDVPQGADAVVMLEYTESYGDGTIGIVKPVAPGENMIFRGDDAKPGDVLLKSGSPLRPHDVGAMAALGLDTVFVRARPKVAILATGDELVPISEKPAIGQIRDVNSAMLAAAIEESGGEAVNFGILADEEDEVYDALSQALRDCDMALISGGSSAGAKDMAVRAIERDGRVLFHGIAMKPGKPTILGNVHGRPVFGLPGHPAAACFVMHLFVRPLISAFLGQAYASRTATAEISEAVPSNHGRAEYMPVKLLASGDKLLASPVHGKSGLITSLSGSDGYICIQRDREGLPKGAEVEVSLW